MGQNFILLVVMVIVLSVVPVLLAGWLLVRAGRRILYRVKYHDFLFERLGATEITARVSRYFDKHTPDFLRLGFELLGDYRLQPGPCPAFARFFASQDHVTFAGIDVYEGTRAYSVFSVLEDGTYVETGSTSLPVPPPKPSDNLRLIGVPGASVEELYARHREAVKQLEEDRQTSVLEFVSEQITEVVDYGHRLVGWSLYRQGVKVEPPVARQPEGLEV